MQTKHSFKCWLLRFTVLIRKWLRMPSFYILALLALAVQLLLGYVILPSAANTTVGIVCLSEMGAEKSSAANITDNTAVNAEGSDIDGSVQISYARAVTNSLLSADSPYNYTLYSSREDLFDAVKSGRADCGFVLDDRLDLAISGEDRVQVGKTEMKIPDLDDTVDYIFSTSTTKGEAVKEEIFACILDVISPVLLTEAVETGTIFLYPDEEIKSKVLAQMESVAASDSMFHVEYATVDKNGKIIKQDGDEGDDSAGADGSAAGSGTEAETNGSKASAGTADMTATNASAGTADMTATNASAGAADMTATTAIAGLLLFAAALFFAASKFRGEQSAVMKMFRNHGLLYQVLDVFAPLLLLGIVLEPTLLFAGNASGGGSAWRSLVFMIPYLLLCSIWVSLFVRIFKHEPVYLFTTVLVILIAIVLSPMLDASAVMLKTVSWIKYVLPSTWFMSIM